MNACIPVLVAAAMTAACGGSVTRAADAGGGGGDGPADSAPETDSGEDAQTCQEVALIPDAAVYTCEAGPPASAGCRAPGLDPNAAGNTNVYPEGCTVTLPTPSTFCGPVGCTCQRTPGFDDGGLQFICPD